MEPQARYALVGIALMVIISGLVFFALWLMHTGGGDETSKYTILFHDISLSGVDEDGLVTLQGIKVGRVGKVEIPQGDVQTVRVTAEIKKSIQIKTNTRAVIRSNLLTGVAMIDLVGSTNDSPPLQNTPGEEFPVIQQGENEMASWMSSLPDAAKNIGDASHEVGKLAKDLDTFVSDENREAFSELLGNARDFSKDLSGESGRFDRFFEQASALMDKAKTVLSELNNPNSPIGRALSDIAGAISRGSVNISSDMGRIAEKIGAASKTLENPRAAIFGAAENKPGPGEKIK